jgi:hypothetical protein
MLDIFDAIKNEANNNGFNEHTLHNFSRSTSSMKITTPTAIASLQYASRQREMQTSFQLKFLNTNF